MEKNMSDGMKLDVRLPIGGMFTLIGAIITVYGLFSDPAIYERSLGINVNLWWGLVLFAFGAFMLIMAWRAAKKNK
jgi:protein-S-isoprenylcysteine O-methyltransferase Ste14